MNMIEIETDDFCLKISASTLPSVFIGNVSRGAQAPIRQFKLGEYLAGQGGIYAGDIRGDDGIVYGLVVASEDLDGTYPWGPKDSERQASNWDGLMNTGELLCHRETHAAARAAKAYGADGHADFYLPAKRELQIIGANLPYLFQPKPYWTSSPYGSYDAWAVNFENGYVSYWDRHAEFRVRPVRRFTY